MKSLIAVMTALAVTACAGETQSPSTTTLAGSSTTAATIVTTTSSGQPSTTIASDTLIPGIEVNRRAPGDLLSLIPDLPAYRYEVWIIDYEMTEKVIGPARSSPGGPLADYWLDYISPASFGWFFSDVTSESDLEFFDTEFGLQVGDVDQEIFVGQFGEHVSVLVGDWDTDRVDSTIKNHPVWGGLVEVTSSNGIVLYDWGPRDLLAEENPARPVGRAGVLVSDSTSEPRVLVRTRTKEQVQPFLDLVDRGGDSLSDVAEYREIADRLAELGASTILLSNTPQLASEGRFFRGPNNVFLSPYTHLGLGRVATETGWVSAVVFAHPDADAAAQNAIRVELQINHGDGFGGPLSERFSIVSIQSDGTFVTVTLESFGPAADSWRSLLVEWHNSGALFQIDDISG